MRELELELVPVRSLAQVMIAELVPELAPEVPLG